MKPSTLLCLSTAPVVGTSAWLSPWSSSSFVPGPSTLMAGAAAREPSSSRAMTMEYVPSGMSKDQWRKLKEQEKTKNQGKDLSRVGITSFKSRSFVDWQKSGGRNLFPVDPTKVKDPSQVPYMQRPGGKADGSDLKSGGGTATGLGSFFRPRGAAVAKEEDQSPPPPPQKSVNWWTLN